MKLMGRGQITIVSIYDGETINISIEDGVRGIAYAADGTNPDPATSIPFIATVLKNGEAIAPLSYTWSCGGNLIGSSTSDTFTPKISPTYIGGNSYVEVSIRIDGNSLAITQTVPIISTKNADGLDWIADWNNGKTTINDKSIVTPRIFAGENTGTPKSPKLTGVAIGKEVLSGNSNDTIGIVGYRNNLPIFKLDQKANFSVTTTGSAGDIENGTNSARGIYFNGDNLFISGRVTMRSGSTMGSNNTDVDTAIKDISETKLGIENASSLAQEASLNAGAAIDKLNSFTLVDGDTTVIDGGKIKTGTLTANSISAGNFTIINSETKQPTFEVSKNGNVNLWGNVESFDFRKGIRGWQLQSNGTAEFNNAIIRASIQLPDAGITNADSPTSLPSAVRFWAGDAFDRREVAPFRVYENGDIVVEKGEFKGTVTGQLDIGRIHIHEDEMVFYEKPRAARTSRTEIPDNPYSIAIRNNQTFFNVNKFSISSEKFVLEGSKNQLSLSNLKIIMNPLTINEKTSSGLNLIKSKYGIASHDIKYSDSSSALIFDSKTSDAQTDSSDFRFENSSKGTATVKVKGDIIVSNKISMRNEKDVYLESKDGSDGHGRGFDMIII